MKFSIHLVLLLFAYSNCLSQNVVVSAAKVNVLYADVDNPFEYAVNDMNCKNYQLTSNNGAIKCNDSCHCSINPINVGTTIIYIKDKKGKLIDSSIYRTKPLPDPKFEIIYPIHCRHGFIVRFRDSVLLEMKDFDFDTKFITKEFTISQERNDTIIASYRNIGNKISGEVKKIYGSGKLNDIFYIENIIVIQPNGRERKIAGIAFKID
jgi:hypothetical protein